MNEQCKICRLNRGKWILKVLVVLYYEQMITKFFA